VRYKPFLSHKRERASSVAYLKQQLCVRGAGGWKDTDDLPKGGQFNGDIVAAIERESGGFILWATRDILQSRIICQTELPTALDRGLVDPTYAVLPVFVDLRPRDRVDIEAKLGPVYTDRLLNRNGLVRSRGQSLQALARDAAREYVRRLVAGLPTGPVDVAISTFRAPTEQHDLSLDWRSLFDAEARTLDAEATETLCEALDDIRQTMQARARTPELHVELTLPMPLAMLVGYRWRETTQLKVTLKTVNPGGDLLVVPPAAPTNRPWPAARIDTFDRSGPYVLAVSVGPTLGATVERYADEHAARGFEHLHVDRDPRSDPLNAEEVRSLAAHIARRLHAVKAQGAPKHLLLRAPASLAAAIGLAANAVGPTWVPFYDGHEYYTGGLIIG
jgi:hypothetical protein